MDESKKIDSKEILEIIRDILDRIKRKSHTEIDCKIAYRSLPENIKIYLNSGDGIEELREACQNKYGN